jgi:hypothetical protein
VTFPRPPDLGWLKKEWWFYATRAEAHLGLGEFPEALNVIREYNAANDIHHQQPPLEQISPWELESTITQLASLIQLQADMGGLLGDLREWKERCFTPLDELRAGGQRMLQDYLGDLAPGLERAMAGKVGLGLSGGGFRASLFHIGVLAYLAEQDLLRHVEVLSCVSGGSIISLG